MNMRKSYIKTIKFLPKMKSIRVTILFYVYVHVHVYVDDKRS